MLLALLLIVGYVRECNVVVFDMSYLGVVVGCYSLLRRSVNVLLLFFLYVLGKSFCQLLLLFAVVVIVGTFEDIYQLLVNIA